MLASELKILGVRVPGGWIWRTLDPAAPANGFPGRASVDAFFGGDAQRLQGQNQRVWDIST